MAIPGDDGGDSGGRNVNAEKMYRAEKLALMMWDFIFVKWPEKTLTMKDLEYATFRWFFKNDTREDFFAIIDRAEDTGMDILYGPTSKMFRRQFRTELSKDTSLRFRMNPEILSMFAFLTAEKPEKPRTRRRVSFMDAFKG